MRRRNIMPFPAGAKPLGALAASAWTAWAVVAIAAAGWLLRALPLMQGGAFGYPVDYDEGVYFASSSLLLRGALPYRDFAFVHPPGLLYCLLPTAWLGAIRDPSIGFAAARWLFALIGVANVLLVGRVAMRFAGSTCALAAAVVYATHPLAVSIERGPFLEPVLNLCCLWLAWIWLAEDDRSAGRRWPPARCAASRFRSSSSGRSGFWHARFPARARCEESGLHSSPAARSVSPPSLAR